MLNWIAALWIAIVAVFAAAGSTSNISAGACTQNQPDASLGSGDGDGAPPPP